MTKRLFQWLFFLIIAVALMKYLSENPECFEGLRKISPFTVLVLAGISVVELLSNGMLLKILLSLFSVSLPYRKCLGISSLASMANYIASFGGGTIGKAFYLKRQHNFSYSAFVASSSVIHMIDFLWVSLLGCLMIVLSGEISSAWGMPFFYFFVFLGIFVLALLCLPLENESFRKIQPEFVRGILYGWTIVKKNRSFILKSALILLFNHLMSAMQLIVGYWAFSVEIGLEKAILMGVLMSIVAVIKLTPANIGIQEAVIAFSSDLFGVGFDNGLLVAGLIRVSSVLAVFVFAGVFAVKWIKEVEK